MFKITNIQVAKAVGALLIMSSGNAFATVTYATQSALNTEITNRTTADSTEKTRATGVEGTLSTAISTEKTRATGVEGNLNTAITAEQTRAMAAEAAAAVPAGAATGDMLYWDETQIKWVVIPAPNPLPIAPNKALLSFCKGVPTWSENCTPVNTTIYHIGDKGQAGGIVFYLNDSTGLHGLEAAPADINGDAQYTWGCWGWADNNYTYTATVGIAIDNTVGAGAANTIAIINTCGSGGGLNNGSGGGSATNAAAAAQDYALNGFTDWYLPSLDELNFLITQQVVVGGFGNHWYWSSTNSMGKGAGEFPSTGHIWAYTYDTGGSVRAVRTF